MTLIQSLRLLRPATRTPQVARLAQSFHVGRPSGASVQDGPGGKRQKKDRVAKGTEQQGQQDTPAQSEAVRISEFKKMRLQALEEVREKGVIKETHPRLVHRKKPMSVPAFRKVWEKKELSDPGNAEVVTLYGTQNEIQVVVPQEQQQSPQQLVAGGATGRVQSVRLHGNKLVFVTIVNEFEKIQGMINYRNLGAHSPDMNIDTFKLFARLIEKGDHISITGRPTRTSTGELTLQAVVLPELLSPAMEQIPQTLTDPATKAAKRHVDMMVNPEVADVLRMRSHITKYMRDYFHDKSFLEFQTPILAENAGGAVARSFTTQATEFPSKELSLRIAPELWLKRLVVGGVHKVFEIGPAFRNEGIDGTHNPEFTMCEFYSAYTNLPELIDRTEELLSGLATHCQELIDTKLTSLQPVDLSKFARPFRQLEFIPALEEALGFRFPKLTGKDAYSELVAVLALSKIEVPGGVPPTMPKLLDRLAAIYLEPKSFEGPLFITHHPTCMSPLAKSFVCPKTLQLVSARTELFVNGRELANMYEEENDPAAQARKLAEHRFFGTGKDAAPLEADDPHPLRDAPLDKSYIRALEAGLPPTGGWGCGVERLVMLFSGASRISDCLSFGTLRNVVGLSAEGPQNQSEAGSSTQAEESTSNQSGESPS
ncbi:lysyl-tRNA synthetase [Colletotrichum lupini]|uniref:Lysyl-tRNA synthetase n=1 Tax=Colletotrichum lupini TaxID=145971 RepID=A0A9Q8T4H3_9PEZI|nr:lysyl-tRNA synthetase [Colletotrichum lupini]UQC88016.1 lysyl-tRNA synthetase [Colletotrichum lupini]